MRLVSDTLVASWEANIFLGWQARVSWLKLHQTQTTVWIGPNNVSLQHGVCYWDEDNKMPTAIFCFLKCLRSNKKETFTF